MQCTIYAYQWIHEHVYADKTPLAWVWPEWTSFWYYVKEKSWNKAVHHPVLRKLNVQNKTLILCTWVQVQTIRQRNFQSCSIHNSSLTCVTWEIMAWTDICYYCCVLDCETSIASWRGWRLQSSPPGWLKLWSLAVGRLKSGFWSSSLGAMGVRCISCSGGSATRPLVGVPGMR